jgi:hypothetical protein
MNRRNALRLLVSALLVALVKPAKAVIPAPPQVPYYYPIPSCYPSHVWVACCDAEGYYPDEGAHWEPTYRLVPIFPVGHGIHPL